MREDLLEMFNDANDKLLDRKRLDGSSIGIETPPVSVSDHSTQSKYKISIKAESTAQISKAFLEEQVTLTRTFNIDLSLLTAKLEMEALSLGLDYKVDELRRERKQMKEAHGATCKAVQLEQAEVESRKLIEKARSAIAKNLLSFSRLDWSGKGQGYRCNSCDIPLARESDLINNGSPCHDCFHDRG